MFTRASFVVFLSVLFLKMALSAAAYSETSVYSWQDEDGVTTFTDDLSRVPSGAKVKVLQTSERPRTGSTKTTPGELPRQPVRIATEGEFAVQLVEELGLSEDPTEEEAADILTDIRIVPRLGQWELNQPMTEELTSR